MNTELELQLVSKYPKMLQRYAGDPMVTCFYWGFETPDAWYAILDELLEGIDQVCHNTPGFQVVAEQVKEKFGGLRFYYDLDIDGLDDDNVKAADAKVSTFIRIAEQQVRQLVSSL